MVHHMGDADHIMCYINYIERQTSNPTTRSRYLMEGMTKEILDHLRFEVREGHVVLDWNELKEAVQDAASLSSLHHRKEGCDFGSETRYDNPYGFKVDQEGFVQIYTDGACFRNGMPDAQAGIGVYFSDNNRRNVSEPLNRKDQATNNVAEIKAVVKALEIAEECGVERVEILTDSMYLIDCIENFMFKWLANGWIKSNGDVVKHRTEYRELLAAMENMNVKWTHVDGHNGVHGNAMADMLAKQGAYRY